jgi:uncharacterized protein (TIGR02246 family)
MTTRESIEAVAKTICQLANAGNAADVAELYTDNAVLLPPGSARLDGRDAIQKYWQGMLDAGVGDISLTTLEVEEAGDSAVEIGVISATAPGEGDARVTLAGKYIVVYRRDGGGNWRLHRDIWNFDA